MTCEIGAIFLTKGAKWVIDIDKGTKRIKGIMKGYENE